MRLGHRSKKTRFIQQSSQESASTYKKTSHQISENSKGPAGLMDSGGKIEKINSTTISAGNTQATSTGKEHIVATERCQHGST